MTGGDAGDGASGEGGVSGTGPSHAGGKGSGELTGSDGRCILFPAVSNAPTRVLVGGTPLVTSDHDCSYSLTSSIEVPLDGGDVRLLFHYDVNGDGVDELFVEDSSGQAPPTLTIVASKLDADGTLSFEPTGCALDLPVSDSYFVRDIDGDGAPDLVIGKPNGVLVLMNRATGPEVTIDYDFDGGSGAQASLMDAAVVDIDKDAKPDVVVGFDRSPDGLKNNETGVLVFWGAASAASPHGPGTLADTTWTTSSGMPPSSIELGYVTAFNNGHEAVGVNTTSAWDYGGRAQVVSLATPPNIVQRLVMDGREWVFIGMQSVAAGYDPTGSQGDSLSLIFLTSFEHELERGFGGGRRHYSTFLFDLDGDGDDDLVETNIDDPSATLGAVKLAIHAGDAAAGPSANAQVLVPPERIDPLTELPFLALGVARGRLLVSGYDASTRSPLRVTGLACE
jgi:hypothetical protein